MTKSSIGSSIRRFAMFLMIAFAVGTTFGQTNQGSISGTILDASGAVVSGASITAKESATGTTYQTRSSSSGSYRFPNLRLGTYTVSATSAGFKTGVESGVVVQVGSTASLDIKLQAGGANETVTVNADAPSVQAETSDMGTVVTEKQVLDLPLALGSTVQAMRSPEAFVFLTPGAVGPGTSNGNGGTFESKISGGQNYATEVLLDGASTYRSENGSSFDEEAPSVEALTEFKVSTSTIPAEMGRTTGGIESFSTKAGTNQYHGSLYDIFRNEDLDANTWANNAHLATNPANRAPFGRPLDRQNDYGGTLGGPLSIPKLYDAKERSFFFFSWEQYRQNHGGQNTTRVPTALERQGNFTETLTNNALAGVFACDGSQVYQGEIFDPTHTGTLNGQPCRYPFAQMNIIPASLLANPANQTFTSQILSYYPTPSQPGIGPNYTFAYSYPILDTSTTVRLDQNIGSRQKAYFTYSSRQNVRTSTTPEFNNAAGAGRAQVFTTHFIRGGYDFTITPSLLNHLNLGYNRSNSQNIGAGTRYGGGFDQKLGLNGVPPSTSNTFPVINVDGVTTIGDSVSGDTIDNGIRVNDNLNWVKGKHDFKVGVDYRYQQYSPINNANDTGTFNFNSYSTAVNKTEAGFTGAGFASLLLGQVGGGNLSVYASQPRWLQSYYGVFFQDNWKVTPTLVLNYGLRWDVDEPRREAHGNTSNISLTAPNPGAGGLPGALVFAGQGAGRNGNVAERWANIWKKDFGPRFGFSYAPAALQSKTVFRGGGGIYYGSPVYAEFGSGLRTGFAANPQFSSPDGGFNPAFTIASGAPTNYPLPPSLNPSQLNFQGPQYIDPKHGRPAMIENWSLEVQHELAQDLILDVAYVGQHSTHLRSNIDPFNQYDPANFKYGNLLSTSIASPAAQAAGFKLPYASYPGNLDVGQTLRPFPQYYGFNTDCCLENLGQSSFHALEASLQRRFRNGLNLMASYTWSKTLTDADSSLPFFATLHGGGSVQNPFNLKAEKAVSNQDTPQVLVLSYIYELPVGKGKKFLSSNRVVDKVVGGWQVGAVQRYQSGQPLSFGCATGVPDFDKCIRYSRVAGQPLASTAVRNGKFNPALQPAFLGGTVDAFTPGGPDPYRYFNYNAFLDQNTPSARGARSGAYAFGTMPRTTGELRSFKYAGEDISIIKRTHLIDGADLRFQASLIDAFNRHVFNRPNTDGANDVIGFGYVDPNATVVGPRIIQFELRLEF